MYGLAKLKHLSEMIDEVCECLGNGSNNNANKLLIETAGAETRRGRTKDESIGAGMGIMQFDEMPFNDVKNRCRESDKNKILNFFDIDIDLVEWEHLRYNPLLGVLFARLKYKKIPEVIPITLEDRAKYHKIWYNSINGKGTIEHYLESNGFDMSKYNISMEIDEKSMQRVQGK